MKTCVLSLLLLLAALCSCSADTPPRYKMTVLPLTFQDDPMNNAPIAGAGINNAGQITGEIRRRGRITPLPAHLSRAYALNDRGHLSFN